MSDPTGRTDRHRRFTAGSIVGALLVLIAGCVYPPPPPGEPVPSLTISVDGVGPVAGRLVVRIAATAFTPTSVTLKVDGLDRPTAGGAASTPAAVVLDTTTLTNGPHQLFVVGADGTRVVVGTSSVQVDNRVADWTAVDGALAAKVISVPLAGNGLVVAQHGAVVHRTTLGAVGGDTVMAIASASKWLSAATIMTLVDEGLLRLDDPISRYLPSFSGAKAGITLRQLLSFTSGLDEDPSCAGNNTITLSECTGLIAAAPLKAAPGSQYRYGSGHLVVAARLAEVRTGTAWTTLFQERIAKPAGMHRTLFVGGANPNPAGSGRSTLDDYERFVRMLWNDGEIDGVRVLSKVAVQEMQRDQTGGAPIVVASGIRKLLGSRYGFGEWFDVLDAATGAYEVSSPGTFGFHPWIDRQRDLYGVYAVEYRGSDDGLNAGGWDVKSLVRGAIDQSIALNG